MNRRNAPRLTFVPITFQTALDKVRIPTEWDDALSVALRSVELNEGLVFALMPTISHTLTAKDISCTLPELAGCVDHTTEAMAEFILDYLAQDGKRVAFIQTHIWEHDPCLQRTETPWVLFSRGSGPRAVCLFQHRDNATVDTMVTALQDRRHLTFVVVLSSLPAQEATITPRAELEQLKVSTVVRHTDFLIVDCFDGDSYLVWATPKVARRALLQTSET